MVIEKGKKKIEFDPIEKMILQKKMREDPDIAIALKEGKPLHRWYVDAVMKRIKSGRVLHKEFNGDFGSGKSMCALTDAYLIFQMYNKKFKWGEEFDVRKRIAQTTDDMASLIDNLKKECLRKHPKGYAIGPTIRDEITFEHGEGSRVSADRLRDIIRTHREDGLWITMVEREPTYREVREVTMAFEVIGNSWARVYEYDGEVKSFHARAKQIANSDEGTLCLIYIKDKQGRWSVVTEGYIIFRSIDNVKVIEDYLKLKREFNEKYGRKETEKIKKVVDMLLGMEELEKLIPVKFDSSGYGSITKTRLKRVIERLKETDPNMPLLTSQEIEKIINDYEIERVKRILEERGEL